MISDFVVVVVLNWFFLISTFCLASANNIPTHWGGWAEENNSPADLPNGNGCLAPTINLQISSLLVIFLVFPYGYLNSHCLLSKSVHTQISLSFSEILQTSCVLFWCFLGEEPLICLYTAGRQIAQTNKAWGSSWITWLPSTHRPVGRGAPDPLLREGLTNVQFFLLFAISQAPYFPKPLK